MHGFRNWSKVDDLWIGLNASMHIPFFAVSNWLDWLLAILQLRWM
jgi:hypothetical protein